MALTQGRSLQGVVRGTSKLYYFFYIFSILLIFQTKLWSLHLQIQPSAGLLFALTRPWLKSRKCYDTVTSARTETPDVLRVPTNKVLGILNRATGRCGFAFSDFIARVWNTFNCLHLSAFFWLWPLCWKRSFQSLLSAKLCNPQRSHLIDR